MPPPTEAKPPQPPDFDRKFELFNYQYVAIPILLLIPLLALFGVFGETRAEAQASGPLALAVDYPDRVHAGMTNEIHIDVTNTQAVTLRDVEVRLDQRYLDRFVNVTFTPDVDRLTGEFAIVLLDDVPPNSTRTISVSLAGHWVGSHTAAIQTQAGDASTTTLTFSTTVFP